MEKSKSKVISLVLLICLIIPFMLTLVTGCLHEHTFASTWSKNATHHWKQATCSHTDEKIEYAEHNIVNNECTVCGHIAIVYTVTSSEWNDVFGGDYLKNATINITSNHYEEGETLPTNTTRIIYKLTESAYFASQIGDFGDDDEPGEYYIQQGDDVYSIYEIDDVWYGSKIDYVNSLEELVVGALTQLFVDRYAFFNYDSENHCYFTAYIDEDDEGDRYAISLKAYVENGKLVKLEQRTQSEGYSFYRISTYNFYNYGTTTVNVPSSWIPTFD